MTVRVPHPADAPGPAAARRFVVWRALPVLGGLVLLFLGALALVVWSTREVDSVSLDRETRMFERSILGLAEQVAHEQESVTIWDDALWHLSDDSIESAQWLDSNLLTWMHDYFGHDEVYILDPEDRQVIGLYDGKIGQTAGYTGARPEIDHLARDLRARLRAGDTDGVSKVLQTIGEADFAFVNGHPALVSVKPMVLSDDTARPPPTPAPGENFLHVSIRYLDGALLRQLEESQSFRNIRFLRHGPVGEIHAETYELTDRHGTSIGSFTWSPFLPGHDVLSRIAPALAVLFVVMLIGIVVGLLFLYRRILGERVARQDAYRLAFYDPVTGLPNRGMVVHLLAEALSDLPVGGPVGVLYVDLERFRLVNETLGRAGGNQILAAVATRLSGQIQDGETVARVGGDEFVILTRGRNEDEIIALADEILAGARVPFVVEGNPVLAGLFVGISIATAPGLSADECLRRADVARSHARTTGRLRRATFGPDMDRNLRGRREIEGDLHRALVAESDEICVFFQPVFSLADGRPVGAEALARWHHPVRGWIAPDVFIPVAEEAELIGQLGARVLRLACREAARWPGLGVAVNASPRELSDPDYPQRVAAALAVSGLPPDRLHIEVTETTMLEAAGQTGRTLATLRGLGVGIIIDDFGTGFSSLSRLRNLDADRIKIDRSFITHICDNATDQAIVQAIVDMAHAAGLQTTVEGVETADQADLLRRIGCDAVQGFFFARPMPARDVEPLLGATPDLPPDVMPAASPGE